MRSSVPWLLVFVLGWWIGRSGPPRSALAEPLPALADVIARADPSVVHVSVQTHGRTPAASRDDGIGSGFVFSAEGLVLTSRHVVAGARAVFVDVLGHGTVPAEVVGHDDAVDLTVLRVPLRGLVPLALGDSRTLRVGDPVVAAGSPFRLSHSWSAGIVSGLHRRQVAVDPRAYEDFIQTDAAANLGSSGGPLLDASGRVVGVLTQILTRAGGFQGITLATPVEAVVEAARRILGSGEPARPSLGVVVREAGSPGAGGLEITRFHPGSPAAAAGLLVGDLVVGVDGAPVRTTAEFQRAIWGRAAGTSVRVGVRRGTQALEVAVTLR
jgi:serine protease Do